MEPTNNQSPQSVLKKRALIIAVWSLRIAVGSVFIFSGLSKMIDLWGFIFKVEQYLSAWGWSVPRSLILMGCMLLSAYEFIFGILLALGCFKRTAPILLMLTMIFMLPLTAYIVIADPVDDCGCFGDAWKISNRATFIKNIVITAALLFLCRYNVKVKSSVFKPAAQWAPAIVSFLYIIIIGLIGYNIQPLIDFRQFAVGTQILGNGSDDNDMPLFIYEKDGETAEFTIDSLPDSTWTFVNRIDNADTSNPINAFSPDGEDDLTEYVFDTTGEQLILVIPEPARADISYTSIINDLYQEIERAGDSMIALLATDGKGVDRWLDYSMAACDCYITEDTQLKELARGVMSLVFTRDGVIQWKRTVSSIDSATVDAIKASENPDFSILDFNGPRLFTKMTVIFIASLMLFFIIQLIVEKVNAKKNRKDKKTV